jgi:Arginase/agmatinase/formimionoglutamate hydrolase, arginase family
MYWNPWSNQSKSSNPTQSYLSVDIDVVDPAAAPGTGTPEAGGISSRELLEAITCMRGLDLVGFDLVEVAPDLDVNNVTSALAAKCVRESLIQWR